MENKKKKILLVDDDIELREIYAEVFQNANFAVIQANDGLDGLDKATKELPDVIFTGIIMPRMDGFDLMEALKKTVMTANIPVVISSHMGRGDDQQRAMQLGAKDFIIRGLTPPVEVIERINALFVEAGDEYCIEFNPTSLDAQKLANELHFQNGFTCHDCQQKLVLKMKLQDALKRTFESSFFCPNCNKKEIS